MMLYRVRSSVAARARLPCRALSSAGPLPPAIGGAPVDRAAAASSRPVQPEHSPSTARAEAGAEELTTAPPRAARACGELVRYVTVSGGCSVKVLQATEMVRRATDLHGAMSPVAKHALGRALMASVLLAAGKDAGEAVTLRFRGGGGLGLVSAEAVTGEDGVIGARGFVENKAFVLPSASPHGGGDHAAATAGDENAAESAAGAGGASGASSAGVGAALGRDGFLEVRRRHPSWKGPYTGVVALATGEVGDDVATYLLDSEQVPSAVGVGVVLDASSGDVLGACGYLCSALPGCSDDELSALEANVVALPPPSELAALLPGTVARRLLLGLNGSDGMRFSSDNPNRWAEHVELRCSCAATGASARALLASMHGLKDDAVKDEASSGGKASGGGGAKGAWASAAGTLVLCEWCGKETTVSQADIDNELTR